MLKQSSLERQAWHCVQGSVKGYTPPSPGPCCSLAEPPPAAYLLGRPQQGEENRGVYSRQATELVLQCCLGALQVIYLNRNFLVTRRILKTGQKKVMFTVTYQIAKQKDCLSPAICVSKGTGGGAQFHLPAPHTSLGELIGKKGLAVFH